MEDDWLPIVYKTEVGLQLEGSTMYSGAGQPSVKLLAEVIQPNPVYSHSDLPSAISTASLRTKPTKPPLQATRRAYALPPQALSSPSDNDNELSTTLRLLMRTLPHSVVVVTSSKAPLLLDESTPQSYRGMTVSSFTTITLSPTPIISFNVKTPSETLSAIRKSENFLLHILEANENGARIADAFTKGNKSVARLLEGGVEGVEIEPVLRMVELEEDEEGEVEEDAEEDGSKAYVEAIQLPMLAGKGVSRVLACEVMDEVEVGDHVVVFASVEQFLGGKGQDELEGEEVAVGGLCYADGRYRRIGDVIEVRQDSGEKRGGGE